MQVLVLNNIPVFFAERDGPWFPTLRLLHQYPDMMVKLRVDAGAHCVRAVQADLVCCLGDTSIAQACAAEVGPCSLWAACGYQRQRLCSPFADQGTVGAVLQVGPLTGTCLQVPSSL